MGYTHYMYRAKNLDPQKFATLVALAAAVAGLVKAEGIELDAQISSKVININGVGDLSHENLYLVRDYSPQPWETAKPLGYFTFCKTAHKPYDTAVTAIMLLAKMLFPDDVTLNSDGLPDDWSEGYRIAQEAVRHGLDMGLHLPSTLQLPAARLALAK